MADTSLPLPTPLPPLPPEEPFNSSQWEILMSIMDTVIPSVQPATDSLPNSKLDSLTISTSEYKAVLEQLKQNSDGDVDDASLEEFLRERPSSNPEFRDGVKRTMLLYTAADVKRKLGAILSLLNIRLGSYLLTGHLTPIHHLPLHTRTVILLSWRSSYLPPLRYLFKDLTLLAKSTWARTSPPLYKIIGYPSPPPASELGSHYPYEFLQFPPPPPLPSSSSEDWKPSPVEISTDIVIIGTGCGGSIIASLLATAGHSVLVLEKGHYHPPSHLPMTESSASVHLFDNGGSQFSTDSSTVFFSGSTFGGGGVINWGASLQTQEYVRREWVEKDGLTFFGGQEWQDALDVVCQRMGVADENVGHSWHNSMLLEGARRLGFEAKTVPQNSGGEEHNCGFCTLGCRGAGKRGTVVTFLADAAGAGARFVEGVEVERILFDETSGKKEKRAVGVRGVWRSRVKNGEEEYTREIVVKAKRVVVSAGSLWSPVILRKSGLKNPNIGANLHSHPVTLAYGIWDSLPNSPQSLPKPWDGSALTTVITSLEHASADHPTHAHGPKLECSCMFPGWCLPALNWGLASSSRKSSVNEADLPAGLHYKLLTSRFSRLGLYISLTRDRDTGSVTPDPVTGKPLINYSPSAFDRTSSAKGVLALTRVIYASGAKEVGVCNWHIDPFIRSSSSSPTHTSPSSTTSTDGDSDDERFKHWYEGVSSILLNSKTNAPPQSLYVSAHQMGTNRMATSASKGVVDQKGKVFGTEGLYVADASILPSAAGVNPMVTVLGLAYWVGRGMVDELEAEGK